MLRLLAENCTRILINYGTIQENQKKIYIYGFELFWSTFLSIISIISIGALLGYLKAAFVFLLFFMPIRMVAGGYHAKSYKKCFMLTNSIAILCVFISKWLWDMDELWVFYFLLGIMMLSFIYIWKEAPVNKGRYSVDMFKMHRIRKYSHFIVMIESVSIIVIKILFNSYILYTSIITTCAVALMISVVNREEVKW